MSERRFFDDYTIGDVRETGGRTITETDIVLHAGQSGDFYPHHMDAEFAKSTPFGQRIAHGTLIFTVAIGLTATEAMWKGVCVVGTRTDQGGYGRSGY